MSGPIKPKEVQSKKDASLPEEVFTVFNLLIQENWDGMQAIVMQDKAPRLIADILNISKDQAYDKRYLDIESIYTKAGWKVKYDKPGYNESYEAFFVFRK